MERTESRDHGRPVLHTIDHEVVIRNPDKNVRHYFYLETDEGEGVILDVLGVSEEAIEHDYTLTNRYLH